MRMSGKHADSNRYQNDNVLSSVLLRRVEGDGVATAADSFFSEFRRRLSENKELSDADKERFGREVDKAIANEPIPTIAIIGETGVGKTTTLNALFNAGAAVGHS